jgi:hypothetical protein
VSKGLKHHQPEDDRYSDATDYAERHGIGGSEQSGELLIHLR